MAAKSSAKKTAHKAASNGQHKSVKSKSEVKTASKTTSEKVSSVKDATEKMQKAIEKDTAKLSATKDQTWFSQDLPQMATMEVMPEVFRAFAEQSLHQTKTAYQTTKENLEKATDTLSGYLDQTSQNVKAIQVKAMDLALLNINSGFDYAKDMISARNITEAFEIQNAHIRKHMDQISTHMKEFQDLSQSVLAETTRSYKA